MIRSTAMVLTLLGLAVALGCVRDNPPPAAKNTAPADEEKQIAQAKDQQSAGEQRESKKADEGLNKLGDSITLESARPDPNSPKSGSGARKKSESSPGPGLSGPAGGTSASLGVGAGGLQPSPLALGATPARGFAGRGGVAGGYGNPRFSEAKPSAGKPGDKGDAKPVAQGVALPPDGHDASNAEKYGTYRENEFRSPLVAALSTFSADVNTASYANVRRMLNQGTMPVKDAVFLAEFINYFPYQYATPKGDDPVEFNMEMGPCPWNRKHHLVRIGVEAYRIPADKMPPRNLVFLIDTSGSMSSPNRLPLVKQALNLLVDQLGEKDRVSIVTYAGDSRVALGPTKGSEKTTIKEIVTNLNATGGTNGEGGIKNAYRLARETFIDGGVNRVILCTDGDFNIGQTSQGELVKMIEDYRRTKVFLTTLGFGMGNYKDEMLKELANHGNGHHAYIDSLDEAKKLFVDQGGALVCVAKDVKFQVDFNPAKVVAYRLIGYENRLLKDEDFKNDAKDAGDMGSGHQVTVLYEIVPVGVPIDLPGVDKSKYTIPTKIDPKAPDEWLTVKMRYKHPEAEVSKELSKPLSGKALGQELSDDFRFAAAAASFGMILRDSQFRGGMTYAGVLEEAQGCVKNDPGGHRKEFLELVKRARDLTAPKPGANEKGISN